VEPWVCGSCRSVNQPRESRCYRCRTPRDVGEADPASMPVSGAVPKRVDVATKSPFVSSAGRAQLAQVVILVAISVVAAAGLILFLLPETDAPGSDQTLLGMPANVVLVPIQAIAAGAALLGWGYWLSRVVANIPALTGEYPNVPPMYAFLESLVPVANLYWIPSILRDVMTRLNAGGRGEALMIGAWLCFVGAIFLPRLNIFASFIAPELGDAIASIGLIGLVAVVLQVIGGILLVMLIQHIEAVVAARRAEPKPPEPGTSGIG
jgi:hypothetical protein